MKSSLIVSVTTVCTVLLFTLTVATSCRKEKSCYSPSLFAASQDRFCPAVCPGVIGCDGEEYCSECFAARQGIPIIK